MGETLLQSALQAVLTNERQWCVVTTDSRDGMAALQPDSVHCVMTSVPYWGLRDYGIEPTVWGGNAGCDHKWGSLERGKRKDILPEDQTTLASRTGIDERQNGAATNGGRFCRLCNAWLGAYGLEPTLELYLKHTVEIFRFVKYCLRPDGILWLNIGDAYANDGKWGGETGGKQSYLDDSNRKRVGREKRSTGLKAKDLCMMPARVAMALQADGWWLRSQCPWIKRNAMPESVTDRPGTAVEYVYLLAKSQDYFYDQEAVKVEALQPVGAAVSTGQHKIHDPRGNGASQLTTLGTNQGDSRRNRRNHDWFLDSWQGLLGDDDPLAFVVNLNGFKEAHFATFPLRLVEPCLKSGTSAKGCCATCGAPWVRQTESDRVPTRPGTGSKVNGTKAITNRVHHDPLEVGNRDPQRHTTATVTTGWAPGCECGDDVQPCLVVDPFNGSGTTGLVAKALGLRYIGFELNGDYAEMARRRIERGFSEVIKRPESAAGQRSLFS